MSRWRAFVEVLDEVLTDPAGATSTTAQPGTNPSARIASTPIYAYTPYQTPNRFWTAPGPYESAAAAEFARHSAPAAKPRAEARAKRRLKPVEESALQTFLRLGGAIDGNFTSKELRSTFRALAQRYHPDRHPHVTDAERSRLGSTFAELTSAYDVLYAAAN